MKDRKPKAAEPEPFMFFSCKCLEEVGFQAAPEMPKFFQVLPPFLAFASCFDLAVATFQTTWKKSSRKEQKAYIDIVTKIFSELSHGISDRSHELLHIYLQKKLRNTTLILVMSQAKISLSKEWGGQCIKWKAKIRRDNHQQNPRSKCQRI